MEVSPEGAANVTSGLAGVRRTGFLTPTRAPAFLTPFSRRCYDPPGARSALPLKPPTSMAITGKSGGGPVIGLDIGTTFIKACQARVKGGRPEITALAVMPTPSDAVSGTEIIDPVTLGRTIKQLFAQAGIS